MENCFTGISLKIRKLDTSGEGEKKPLKSVKLLDIFVCLKTKEAEALTITIRIVLVFLLSFTCGQKEWTKWFGCFWK